MDQAVDTTETSSTELAIVQTTLTEFDKISAGLAELTTKYDKAVFSVETAAGMVLAKQARQEIRAPRYATEQSRKAAKTKILALGKNVDERAAQITAGLTALEDPIHAQIAAEEKRKEDERAARAKAEQERLARIQAAIGELKDYVTDAAGKPAVTVEAAMEQLEKFEISKDRFGEFTDIAESAKVASMNRLNEMYGEAVVREEAAAKLKAEQEELARRQAEQLERERVESERLSQEAAQRDAEDRARREVLAAEEAAAKARIEANAMAMQEIQGIQQQVMIAQLGRAGVRVGGTIQCIEETLAETERWPIEDAHFGALADSARAVKSKAIATIKDMLDSAKAREEGQALVRAEADRLATERLAKEQREREAREKAEAKAKAKRDKEEAAERERLRKATEVMDARQMLEAFVTMFGHIKDFSGVVKAIESCLAKETA